jgi:hypothetical protein
MLYAKTKDVRAIALADLALSQIFSSFLFTCRIRFILI